MFIDEMKQAASDYGIELSGQQLQQFNRYYELLVEWNEKMNLTAITEPHDASLYQLAYHEPVEALPAYEALLQGIRDGGGNDGVGLSKTRISPVARNVSEQLLHKLAISGGTSAASALAGGIAGSVISLGATVFGVIWHEAGRKEIETELRATLSDSVADMWRSLMDNPDTGVAAGIYHIADQIENHLPQTVARPIPFENPPREIPLPELPPSPETGDGEEALDEGGDQ